MQKESGLSRKNSFSLVTGDPLLSQPRTDLNLIGHSSSFQKVLHLIERISRCEAPVLILGETGTGKEMAARAIHYLGNRREFPFVPVNCGAIPDNLVENELFGHVQGAFTDARDSQRGLIHQAHGGTLFLDEVDTLSSKAQVALLRFLQDQKYRALGSKTLLQGDVRIIAASNQDLHQLAEQGAFRHDLMFRLDIMDIVLPPLRERVEDLEALGKHFLGSYSKAYNQPDRDIHPETLQWMRSYHWPGNIRELENVLHRAFLLSDEKLIKITHSDRFQTQNVDIENNDCTDNIGTSNNLWNFKKAKSQMVQNFETQFLIRLMVKTHGNVSEAAKISGKERRSLGKLLKKYGIETNRYRNGA